MKFNKFYSITIFLISLMFLSCSTTKITSKDLEGVYIQKNDKRIELHLSKNEFVLVDNFEPSEIAIKLYECCDTITFGNWRKEKELLLFSTPEELNTFYLNIDVEENTDKNSNTISFIIDNPIENNTQKNSKQKELIYSINFYTSNGIKNIITENNQITISEFNSFNKFEITIFPKCSMQTRNLATREVNTLLYEVKNINSNVFEIKIPKLDYKYLTIKRLKGDFIKITNKEKLIWDGEEYVKK